MSSIEGGFITEARAQVQQTAELARHQKEADQMSRQLFADCVETVDRFGVRARTRAILTRTIDSDGGPLQIRLTTAATPRKSPDVSIWLDGTDHRLILNRYKGYGEVHLNDPQMNEPTYLQGRANIHDVTNFTEAVRSMRDFIKTPTVPVPDDVMRYSQMGDGILEEELKKARRWSGINLRAGQLIVVGAVMGIVLGAESKTPELAFGSASLTVVVALASGRVGISLDRRSQIIQDEIASRH